MSTQKLPSPPKLTQIAPNFSAIRIDEHRTIWFAYETAIAFGVGSSLIIRQNTWGNTVSRYINALIRVFMAQNGSAASSIVNEGAFLAAFRAAFPA